MSFSAYSAMFLDFKREELKHSTFYKYEQIVKSRLLPFFKDMEIENIKPSDLKKWLYSVNDVGAKSKKHYLGVLSGIFNEALLDEVISRNPVKLIRAIKYNKPAIKPFNADEVARIMDNAPDNNFKYYLAMAFYTGMRSGEIIGLKKKDIDFKDGLINIERSRSRFGESTPKTKYSIRQIPIIKLLEPYLLELYNKHDNEYLFITQYNEPYRDTTVFVNQYWIPSLNDLGIAYRRPYNTRHTYATNMLYNNIVSPVELAYLLGHSNAQMVYEVYVSYIDSNYKEFDRSILIYK